MNSNFSKTIRRLGLALSIMCVLLAIAGVAWLALRNTQTPPPNQARVEQRLKLLTDLRGASEDVLQTYDWQNKEKGVVRVPIARAKELTAQEWKDPAAARSNLMARAAVALAVPPPPDAVPNPYE